jgi:hypothetical protein
MSAEDTDESWMSAQAALSYISRHMAPDAASRAICTRAHAGLVRARAVRFMKFTIGVDDFDVPKHFWWAKGEAALKQNWVTGDFKTWIDRKIPLHAYGVKFMREDIVAMVGSDTGAKPTPKQPLVENHGAAPEPVAEASERGSKAGRPPDERWEDVLIEIGAQLYLGDLKPTKQVALEKAMLDCAAKFEFMPSESSAKLRARKLFKLIEEKG